MFLTDRTPHPCQLKPDGFCQKRFLWIPPSANKVILCSGCTLPEYFGYYVNLDRPPQIAYSPSLDKVYLTVLDNRSIIFRDGSIISWPLITPLENILRRYIDSL